MARRQLTRNGHRRPAKANAFDLQEVAQVAYDLFEHRGGAHGHDLDDWLEAEAIVRQRHAAPPSDRVTDFL